MEESTLKTHPFLKSRTLVGSASYDKSNFALDQKIFHPDDVPPWAKQNRQETNQSKKKNILGTEQSKWNQSTIADQKIQKDALDVKQRLLKIRAGLANDKVSLPSRMHCDEEMVEKHKFVAMMSGKGPIGRVGKWFNAVDERGLAAHCIRDDWPDWNLSVSTHTKEDLKQAVQRFDACEALRRRCMERSPKLNDQAYISPSKSQGMLTDRIREVKIDFQELKDEFKRSLKEEFPGASEERLQAMSQRLLGEKLLADEKARRFPAANETMKPNIAVTAQDRRFKVYHHPGSWSFSQAEQRHCWSCCMNFSEDSRGCERKIVNPDTWCTLGYERSPGFVMTGKV